MLTGADPVRAELPGRSPVASMGPVPSPISVPLAAGGRFAASRWLDVHVRGGDIAIGLALIATVVGLVEQLSRKDLVVGTTVLRAMLSAPRLGPVDVVQA
jgi:hypothetical protein